MPSPDQEFQLIFLPSPDGLKLWVGKPQQALPAGASLVATFGRYGDIAQVRRALADRIGPFASILLDAACCEAMPDLLPQIRTALVKLSHSETMVHLCDAAGDVVEASDATRLAPQLKELRQAIAALKRLTRLRPQDGLRVRWQARRASSGSPIADIAVLGGGIAGVTLALELHRRGIRVTLIEAQGQLLSGASNQPTLACHPQFSRDQDMLSQLTQQALRLTLDSPYADLFVRKGRLTPALSAAHAREQQAQVKRLGLPSDMLRFVDAAEAVRLAQWPERTDTRPLAANAPCAWGGLWTDLGASLPVASLRERTEAQAATESARLRLLTGQQVHDIQWRDAAWQLTLHRVEQVIQVQAQGVVLACGAGTPDLLRQLAGPARPLALSPLPAGWEEMGGQTFLANSPQWHVPDAAPTVGGPVTLQRIARQTMVLGSSYYEPDAAPADHTQWQALQHKLAQFPGMDGVTFECLGMHAGVRCYTPDRMPLIGPLLDPAPDQGLPVVQTCGPGSSLWLACAFGSRGLLWAHLAARLIADQVEGKAPVAGMKALKSIDALRYATVPTNASPART